MSAAWGARLRQVLALGLVLPLVFVVLALARRAKLGRADFVFNNGNEVNSLDPTTVSGQSEGRVVARRGGLFGDELTAEDFAWGWRSWCSRLRAVARERSLSFVLMRSARGGRSGPGAGGDRV